LHHLQDSQNRRMFSCRHYALNHCITLLVHYRTTIVNSLQAGIVGLPNVGKVCWPTTWQLKPEPAEELHRSAYVTDSMCRDILISIIYPYFILAVDCSNSCTAPESGKMAGSSVQGGSNTLSICSGAVYKVFQRLMDGAANPTISATALHSTHGSWHHCYVFMQCSPLCSTLL
jgi:hypothetical protein